MIDSGSGILQARLRIVMPVLNEGAGLTARLAALQSLRQQGAQLIVVDGGSTDESWARAQPWADRVIGSPPGRAQQMNVGALDTVLPPAQALLFLHADTQLPPGALHLIEIAIKQRAWGRFDVRLDAPGFAFRMIETMMNLRSRFLGIATGDQAMFVRFDAFQAVGGFPTQALMEDIELSSRLLKISRPACLQDHVITSARKWKKNGIWPTIFLMWRLRLAYFFGAKPNELALKYGYRAAPPTAQASIAILAKAPIAGLAKTRLIPALGKKGAALGAVGAARAQRQFILQTLHTAHQAKLGSLTLWCAPDAKHRHFRALHQQFNIHCQPQPEGDLGIRMQRCAETHFSQTDAALLIIGTDCAVLSPGHLHEAARSLGHHDACFIPAEDGGYVLIGLKKVIPEVFSNITWSTGAVLTQSLERLNAAGANVALLPALWDVDEPADWQRLQAMNASPAKESTL
jgi:rSAM/selenodomain-associated transferase 2/rSAM/selenodomain-associated transferase 1